MCTEEKQAAEKRRHAVKQLQSPSHRLLTLQLGGRCVKIKGKVCHFLAEIKHFKVRVHMKLTLG
jgi:hypothetical protein